MDVNIDQFRVKFGSIGLLAQSVLNGERAAVARAITLVESRRADHREQAQELLRVLLPHTGKAQRVGISGVPGVGKSTFIDQLGMNLIAEGHRVAVLAVDPSSSRTGGSILGDKTRMTRLAADERSFVRPSPSAGTLGGVAKATRETMLVMEAAGYDIVLIETVGVGQSEYVVANMVDTFLFLALARTGDQLQGMKRGILELADVIGVNKADEEHERDSARAARELSGALRFLRGAEGAWQSPVVTCSGLHNVNLDKVWHHVERHRAWLEEHYAGPADGRSSVSGGASGSNEGEPAADEARGVVREGAAAGEGRETREGIAGGATRKGIAARGSASREGAAAREGARKGLASEGGLAAKRRTQLVDWTRAMVRDRLLTRLEVPEMRTEVARVEAAVLAGELTPDQAATQILRALDA